MINEVIKLANRYRYEGSDPYRSVLDNPIQFWACSSEEMEAIPTSVHASISHFFSVVGCGIVKKSSKGMEGRLWRNQVNHIISPLWAREMMSTDVQEREDEGSVNESHFQDGCMPFCTLGIRLL